MRVYTIAIAGQPGSEVLQTDSPPEGAGTNRWGTIGGSFIIHGVTSLMLVQAGGPPQTIDQWSLDGESLWRERYTGDGRYIYQIRAATPRAGLVDAGRLEGGFTLPALCASEPGGVAVVPVSLDTAPVDTRVLTYTIAGGTAGPSDIALPASGALVFGPGQRQALLDIPVVADGLAEPPETLLLSLAADPASVEVTRASLTLSILDEGTCQARMPLVVRP
jgi:hypothetical protein